MSMKNIKPLDGEMSITQNLFSVVTKLWPALEYHGIKVLELGSGIGTGHWVKEGYDITTVEHDLKWINSCEGAHYIHAPLTNAYYPKDVITELFKNKFDIWIIDGPPGILSDRTKILDIFEAKDKEVCWPKVIIVDDCQREDGQKIADYFFNLHRGCPIFEVSNTKLGGPPHTARILLL